jgi:hypothetical protein
MGKVFWNYSYLKPLSHLTASLVGIFLYGPLPEVFVSCVNQKSNMAAITEQSFQKGPYGNMICFSRSETRNMIESKLFMNSHVIMWMVP